MVDQSSKMGELEAAGQKHRVDPSAEMLVSFEERFELALPPDYRAFLGHHGSMTVQAAVGFQEPTPLGDEAPVHEFFGFSSNPKSADLGWAMNIAEGRGICVPVAANYLGHWYFLMVKPGRWDVGHVYLRNHQRRHDWSDETFRSRLPKMAPAIERYVTLRGAGDLPPVLSRTPGWYLVGSTFDDFLSRCRRHRAT